MFVSARSLALCAVLSGCGVGKIRWDDGSEPIRSAWFIAEDERIRLFLSDIDDGCTQQVAFLEALESTETPTDQAAAWSSAYPEAFWLVDITFLTDEPVESTYHSTESNVVLSESGQFRASLTRYSQALDEAYWSGAGNPDDYTQLASSTGGDVEIQKFTETQLKGRSESEITFDSGEESAEISFHAEFCAEFAELQ